MLIDRRTNSRSIPGAVQAMHIFPSCSLLLDSLAFSFLLFRTVFPKLNFVREIKNCEWATARRSRPSVSKVISQPRSLGGRRPVDRAAGAALRLIDLTHVRVYSKATHDDFLLLSSIQRSDQDWRSLAFLSSSITSADKNCSQTKNKRPCKRPNLPPPPPPSVAGSSFLRSSKVKK